MAYLLSTKVNLFSLYTNYDKILHSLVYACLSLTVIYSYLIVFFFFNSREREGLVAGLLFSLADKFQMLNRIVLNFTILLLSIKQLFPFVIRDISLLISFLTKWLWAHIFITMYVKNAFIPLYTTL